MTRNFPPQMTAIEKPKLTPQEYLAIRRSAELEHAAKKFSRQNVRDELWKSFSQGIFYHRSEFGDPDGYKRLAVVLDKIDAERGTRGNRLFYLAVAPSDFEGILLKLKEFG